jgi:phosphoglycolate phosphatase
MRFSAILFDLDGTLVDSAPDLAAATDHVLASYGRPPVGLAAVRHMVGDGARALVERGFAATGAPLPADQVHLAVRRFLDHYGGNLSAHTRPFDGVAEVLERLRTAGATLAVCTNKVEGLSRAILRDLRLDGFFADVVGGDTLAVKKPHAGHLTGTLGRLGLAGRPAAMVGDSANDVLAARAAGLPVVAVSFGYTRIPAADLGADRVIDRFADLPAALGGL